MRIDVKKFVFIGLSADKNAFFKEAQKIGIIHFNMKPCVNSPEVQLYTDALKILRGQPTVKPIETLEPHGTAVEIKNLKDVSEQIQEEIRLTKLEIERVSVFGEFSLKDVSYLREKGSVFIQFFCSKKTLLEKQKKNAQLIHIGSNNDLEYFISLNSAPASYEGMIEIKIDSTLNEQKKHLKELKQTLEQTEKALNEKACYSKSLHHALTEELNKENLNSAEDGAEYCLDNALFSAIGWVPDDKWDQIQALTKNFSVYASEIAVSPSDVVPTYLENEHLAKIGEDIIGIYDTPSSQDKDPSLWVLFGFLIFFSIIIGDGGYGSIYLGLILYLRYKFPDIQGVKKRILKLSTYLASGCVIWGILSASFFGLNLTPENPVRSYSLITYLAKKKAAYHANLNDPTYKLWTLKYPEIQGEKDPHQMLLKGYVDKEGTRSHELLSTLTDQVLLEIALFIGVIHLITGLLRYQKKNPSNIGWVIFLVGSYLYFPVFLGVPSLLNYVVGIPFLAGGQIGLYMILTGIPLSVGIAVIKNGIFGLTEIMNLIQVFADGLSYLRLYALGLSGSILSGTINSMAGHMPLVFGIGLIIIGHAVNMVLGLMGGVIHGLRLNFLEWYHYSFEGGGRKFKPLELKKNE